MSIQIRNLIDEIFSEMKMSRENLALRDELMANAQARYDDAIARGDSEEEALAQVTDSLGNVRALLQQMDSMPVSEKKEKEKPAPFWSAMEEGTAPGASGKEKKEKEKLPPLWSAAEQTEEPEEAAETRQQEVHPEEAAPEDVTLEKAVNALGELGGQIFRGAGSAMRDLGKAACKGVQDMTRAAEDVMRSMGWTQEAPKEQPPQTREEMLRKAESLREQAEQKQAQDQQEEARQLRRQAYLLEQEAENPRQPAAREGAPQEAPDRKEEDPAWLGADGKIDPEAFARAADELAEQAERAAQEAHDASFRIHEAAEETRVINRFSPAGLQKIVIEVDADDVTLCPAEGDMVEVVWEAGTDGESSPGCVLENHTLHICGRSQDLFKSFFSVFNKEGGQLTVKVPRGYAAAFQIKTTSGDILLQDMDCDQVDASTASGGVRLMPDNSRRSERIAVNTVSGPVTVSVCCQDVQVKTVTGEVALSCDAARADVDTVSARVRLDGASDIWEINSVSGDVELVCTAVPAGKIAVGTVTAKARISLPAGIRGFVAEASGPNAALVNEFGPDRYGTCQLPIHMDTLSGRLIITRI